uniref:Ig-like domain-containing protein n=1 Tax=Chrysemys picta bellii TaxID=8478 RepID=A0A8C3HNH8_CHRPI
VSPHLTPVCPKPNISLHPSGRVALRGGAVTIWCHGRHQNMRFLLYKVGNLNVLQDLEPAGDVAEFPICNVSQRDAGSYRCRYSTKSDPPMWSEPSDPVELVVAGEGPARRPRSQPHTQTDPQKISALRMESELPSCDRHLVVYCYHGPVITGSNWFFPPLATPRTILPQTVSRRADHTGREIGGWGFICVVAGAICILGLSFMLLF